MCLLNVFLEKSDHDLLATIATFNTYKFVASGQVVNQLVLSKYKYMFILSKDM